MAKYTRDKIAEILRAKVVEQLGVEPDQVVDSASFQEDLDADSLDLVELIMEMEDVFGVKIPDEDAQKITTFGQAVDYVLERQDGPAEGGEGGEPVPVTGPAAPVSDADGTTAEEATVDSTP